VTLFSFFESSEKTQNAFSARLEASEDFLQYQLRRPGLVMNLTPARHLRLQNRVRDERGSQHGPADRPTAGALSRAGVGGYLYRGEGQTALDGRLADIGPLFCISTANTAIMRETCVKESVAISRNFIRKGTDWIARCGSDNF
jgi:hypothetical protein